MIIYDYLKKKLIFLFHELLYKSVSKNASSDTNMFEAHWEQLMQHMSPDVT